MRAVAARLNRTGDIDPNERTVARPEQEPVFDQFGKHCVAERGFQRPQTTCLWFGEAQAWHFQEFPLNASDDVFAETNTRSVHSASSRYRPEYW
jgi:hypothetical protein